MARSDAGAVPLVIETVAAVELVRQSVRSAARRHGLSEPPIEIAAALEEPLVSVDRRRFERVIANLIDNAYHYAGGATAVRLDVEAGQFAVNVDDAGTRRAARGARGDLRAVLPRAAPRTSAASVARHGARARARARPRARLRRHHRGASRAPRAAPDSRSCCRSSTRWRRETRYARLARASLGALALAGCSFVAPNAAPTHIASSKVPFGLLNKTIPGTNHARVRFNRPSRSTSSTSTGHLAPSSRIVPSPPALATVIEQLLLGPTAIESVGRLQLGAAENAGAGLGQRAPRRGLLELRDVPRRPLAPKQMLAIGQLAFTGADAGAPKGIVVKVAGVIQELVLPNGRRSTIASDVDFESLLN